MHGGARSDCEGGEELMGGHGRGEIVTILLLKVLISLSGLEFRADVEWV